MCEQRVRDRETREVGIAMWQCLAVLENDAPQTQHDEWATVRLHFDGGARGNPGPSGSGWALLKQDRRGNWDIDACGHKYQGEKQTNNFSEYEALREGMALAWRRNVSAATHLQVRGDSNMTVKQMTGRAAVKTLGFKRARDESSRSLESSGGCRSNTYAERKTNWPTNWPTSPWMEKAHKR